MGHRINRRLSLGMLVVVMACLLAAIVPTMAFAASGGVRTAGVMVRISGDSQAKASLDAYRVADTTFGKKAGDLTDKDVAYPSDAAQTAMVDALGKLTGKQWDGTAAGALSKLTSVADDDATTAASVLARSVTDAGMKPSATIPSDGSETSMPNGLYVLVPSGDTGDKGADASSSVTPIMHLFDGVEGNVSISEKSSAPSIEKSVNGAKVSAGGIGEKLSYDVAVTLPTNYDAFGTYPIEVTDVLDKGLTLDEDSVRLVGDDGNALAPDNGWYSSTVTKSGDGQTTLKVRVDDLKSGIPLRSVSKRLHVSYTASVNADATLGTDGPNENTATFGYQRSPYDKTMVTSIPVITKTFASSIGIMKVDASTKNAVDGARLSLRRDSDGKWWDGKAWTDAKSDFEVNGEALIPAIGSGSYKLSETHAPDGYEAFKGDAKVDVNMGVDGDGKLRLNVTVTSPDGSVTVASSDARTGKASVVVADTRASDASAIRQTGDRRATALAVVAAAAAVVAGVIIVVRQRRK